ncbi:hypothetical protein HZC07_02825 [Candidatus Micrarchaeota archaeon]|nr:hypothetical protein [Candidatus Micrarchaeota archaeon]
MVTTLKFSAATSKSSAASSYTPKKPTIRAAPLDDYIIHEIRRRERERREDEGHRLPLEIDDRLPQREIDRGQDRPEGTPSIYEIDIGSGRTIREKPDSPPPEHGVVIIEILPSTS